MLRPGATVHASTIHPLGQSHDQGFGPLTVGANQGLCEIRVAAQVVETVGWDLLAGEDPMDIS